MSDAQTSMDFIRDNLIYEDLRKEWDRLDINANVLFLIQISRQLLDQSEKE